MFDTRCRAFTPSELSRLADVGGLVASHLMLHATALELEEQLGALSAASPIAIIFAHRDGTIEGWNTGVKDYALAPPDRVKEVQRLRHINLERGEIFHGVETKRLTRAGMLLDVSMRAGPAMPMAKSPGPSSSRTIRNQQNCLREAERKRSKILELAANDSLLAQIFGCLVESVEFSIDDGICTILRCKGNALEHVASGPSLPRGDRPGPDRVRPRARAAPLPTSAKPLSSTILRPTHAGKHRLLEPAQPQTLADRQRQRSAVRIWPTSTLALKSTMTARSSRRWSPWAECHAPRLPLTASRPKRSWRWLSPAAARSRKVPCSQRRCPKMLF